MDLTSKIILTAAAALAAATAPKESYQALDLHLPTGTRQIAGYHYDLTASKVYGAATPMTFTEKYLAAWIGDVCGSIARTDKHWTDDPSESWTVWTLEISKAEDEAWFRIEFGK